MPKLEQSLFLYRDGMKVGEVKSPARKTATTTSWLI